MSDPAAQRRAQLPAETPLREGGRLFVGLGILECIAAFGLAAAALARDEWTTQAIAAMVVVAVFAVLHIAVGSRLAAMRLSHPWPVIALSILGLPSYPFGSVLGGWILWHLRADGSRALFGPGPAAVRAATPELDPVPGNGPVVLGVMLVAGTAAVALLAAMVV